MSSNILERVVSLNLPQNQYLVCGSGILDLLNLRPARDIDLLVSKNLFDELKKQGWISHSKYPDSIEHPEGIAGAKLHLDFMREDYTLEELLPKAHREQNIPFMDLETLRNAKLQLGRDKDIEDIKLIDEYLSK